METYPLPEPSSTAPPAAPSVDTLDALTVWEAKERAGLLAIETDEWRQKRLIAENPDTTGNQLQCLANDLYSAPSIVRKEKLKGAELFTRAVSSHPNTPLPLLAQCIGYSAADARAFCTNPIVPFVLLEKPNFISGLHIGAQGLILGCAFVLPHFVSQLAIQGVARTDSVRWAARLHISCCGEVGGAGEAAEQITQYWQAYCGLNAKEGSPSNDYETVRQWHVDLVESGLAPVWAAGPPPLPEPPQSMGACMTYPAMEEWLRFRHTHNSPEEAEMLQIICVRGEDKGRVGYALRASATPSDLQTLFDFVPHTSVGVWTVLLQHPNVTAEIIQQMAQRCPPMHYASIALHPMTSPDTLAFLLQSDSPSVRRLARRHPNAPPEALVISQQKFYRIVEEWRRDTTVPRCPAFVSFVSSVLLPECVRVSRLAPAFITAKANSSVWTSRLEAALLAVPDETPLVGDAYERAGLDLLHHLARDGNRLVRWAAKTRLADPDFTFTWHEGNE